MRVALVHDWLTGMRGGEWVLYDIARLFPSAPIYTLVHRAGSVAPLLEEHPIRKFYEEGLLVFVNTDDPKMFNTSLDEEYAALARDLNFDARDIFRLIENAIHSAWCDQSTKEKLRAELTGFQE